MSEEIWKDIKEYSGKYQIGSKGHVRSMNYNNTGKPKELKLKRNTYGFNEVTLSKNNKTKTYMVARLVAEHFIPNPNNKPKVMHIGDGADDSVENLKWAYESEIKFNMYKRGRRKLVIPRVYRVSYKHKYYKTFAKLAREYGITNSQLLHRLNKGWTVREAIEIPIQPVNHGARPRIAYEFYGEILPIKEIAKRVEKEEQLIRQRLSKGYDIYNAAETPVAVSKRRKK